MSAEDNLLLMAGEAGNSDGFEFPKQLIPARENVGLLGSGIALSCTEGPGSKRPVPCPAEIEGEGSGG
jgi:hypothetical protein